MIRRANINDIFAIAKTENEVLGFTLGTDFLYNELSASDIAHYFVYELNKEIIGYVGFRIYDNNAEMMNFVIGKHYQNHGYGQAMFDYFIEYSKVYQINFITLEVRKSNKKAIRFYTRNGFTKSYVKENYYKNEDAIVYLKEVE